MTDIKPISWVVANMPEESAKALEHFVALNPRWQGAGWDDCLDSLLDTDSHLEVTDRLWEAFDGDPLAGPVGVTLLWSSNLTADVTADAVRAVLPDSPD